MTAQTAAHEIGRFAQEQLAQARHSSGPSETFQCLNKSVRVFECEPIVRPHIAPNLLVGKSDVLADYTIALKYNRDFVASHPPKELFADLSDMAIEQMLALTGVYGRFCRDPFVWELFDPHAKVGLRLQLDAEVKLEWEQSAPLANFVGWIGRCEGFSMLHAGTLGIDSQGVLLAGDGGSGKSGMVLGGLLNGLTTVGDDYVLVKIDDTNSRPAIAKPTFKTTKQDSGGLARCKLDPSTLDGCYLNWNNKHVFPINAIEQDGLRDQMDIHAICLPRICGTAKTQISEATAADAFNALMPTTLGQLSGDRRARISEAARLSRLLPSYWIDLGTDPDEISAQMRNLIQGLSL